MNLSIAFPGETLSAIVTGCATATPDANGVLVGMDGGPVTGKLVDASGSPSVTFHAVLQAAANAYDPSTGIWNTTATDIWGWVLDANGDPNGVLNQYLPCVRQLTDDQAAGNPFNPNLSFNITGVDGVVVSGTFVSAAQPASGDGQ